MRMTRITACPSLSLTSSSHRMSTATPPSCSSIYPWWLRTLSSLAPVPLLKSGAPVSQSLISVCHYSFPNLTPLFQYYIDFLSLGPSSFFQICHSSLLSSLFSYRNFLIQHIAHFSAALFTCPPCLFNLSLLLLFAGRPFE